jgi:hypothetical protein
MSGHAITPTDTRGSRAPERRTAHADELRGYDRALADVAPAYAQAQKVADQLARHCIQTACQPVRSGGSTWYDTTQGFEDQEQVDVAYAWLLGRGTTIQPPMTCCQAFPALVRFEDAP